MALVLVAGAGILGTAPHWVVDGLAVLRPGCLYRVAATSRVVALTIDDGPDSLSTRVILDELQRYGARATFFLLTDRVAGQEQIVRALVVAGHELGNHFTSDRPSIRLSLGEFEADLLRAHAVLEGYGPVTWTRPGSGWYDGRMIATMQRQGYRCALGSVYPFDALVPSVSFAARYILRNVRPGAILVLHDGGDRGRRTAKTLSRVLPELRRRGYQVVTLTELVEWPYHAEPRSQMRIPSHIATGPCAALLI